MLFSRSAKTLVGVLLVPAWMACGTKAKKNEEKDAPANPDQKVAEEGQSSIDARKDSDLVGTWVRCKSLAKEADEMEKTMGEPYPVRAMRVTTVFMPDGTGQFEVDSAADEECLKTTTADEIKAFYETAFNNCAKAFPREYCDVMKDVSVESFQSSHSFNYTASPRNDQGDGELDLMVKSEPPEEDASKGRLYLSYRLEADGLRITESCDTEDIQDGTCTNPSGESAENRAKDFSLSNLYKKVL